MKKPKRHDLPWEKKGEQDEENPIGNANDMTKETAEGSTEGAKDAHEESANVSANATDGQSTIGEEKPIGDANNHQPKETAEGLMEDAKDVQEESANVSLNDKIEKFKELFSSINFEVEFKHKFIRIYEEIIKDEEFKKDVKADNKRKQIAEKIYNFWTDKLDVLGDNYINDLLYDYDEILEEFEGFKIGKKSIVIAIDNNPQRNKEILSTTLKELLEKVDVMTRNNDIMSVKRVREDSRVLYLDSTNLDESEVESLNGTLRSLLLILKNLVKEKDRILSIDNQINNTIKQLYSPMKIESVTLDIINSRLEKLLDGNVSLVSMPSNEEIDRIVKEKGDVTEELIVNSIFKEEIVELLKDDVNEFIKETLTSDNSTSKSILENVNKFQKSMVKFFNESVIKAYNSIKTTRRNFTEVHEGKQFQAKWEKLFNDLESYLLDFLEKFDISKISVKRGDDYDPNIHLPITEAESDEELQNDQIKSVENDGFEFTNHLIFEDAETSNHILKQAEVIVVRNN